MSEYEVYVTVHDNGDGTMFAHTCSDEKPCGDVLACRRCRYM